MPHRAPHVWSRRSTAPHLLGARAPAPVPGLLGGIVGGVADTVGDVASPVVSDVASVAAGAASVVDKVASPVVAEATKVVDAVTSAVGVVASPVVTEVTKVAAPIVSEVNSVVSDVTSVAGPVVSELTSIAGPVVSELSSIAGPIVSKLSSAVAPVISDVTSAVAPIVSVVSSVAHPVISVVSSVAQPVISVVSSVAEPVTSDLNSVLSTVASEISSLAPPVGSVLSSLSSVVDNPTPTKGNGDPPGTTATFIPGSNDSNPATPKATATTEQGAPTSVEDPPVQTGTSSADVGSSSPSAASSAFDSSASLLSLTTTLESGASESVVVYVSGSAVTRNPNVHALGPTGTSFGVTFSGSQLFPTTLTVGSKSDGNGTDSPSGSEPGSGSGSNGSAKSRLSPGIIAAIAVVVGLFFFALIILVVRRCYKKRRAERFQRWTERGGFTFLIGGNHSEKGGAAAGVTASPRSSFGTSHDHGERPFTPEPMPPAGFAPLGTASSTSGFSHFYSAREGMTPDSTMGGPGAAAPPLMSPMQPEGAVVLGHHPELSSQFSIGSETGEGEGADANAQYLLAPPMQDLANMAQLSPISVRPWSPSERWAFPKPPSNADPADPAALESVATPTTASTIKAGGTQASLLVPGFVPRGQSESDPFADPDPEHGTVTGSVRRASASSLLSAHSSASANSYLTASSGEGDALAGVLETIKRPFAPTLGDEVAVRRGEQIRILRSFDDGWVQIEKVGTEERGLIPIDCLRDAGEPLPAFLAARRVSSYGTPSV